MAGDENTKKSSGLAEAAPHYHGHRQRLRQRFLEAGSEAVSDYELLELVLFRAIPQRDLKPLAKSLITTFGSFAEVIAAPPKRLAEIKGLGDAAIVELKVVQAAANRLARGQVKKRPLLSSWSNVLDYCRTAMAFADKEQFRISSGLTPWGEGGKGQGGDWVGNLKGGGRGVWIWRERQAPMRRPAARYRTPERFRPDAQSP